ncbi:EamA family transporter [Baekduia soli]|uniref:EamA family transporter n=1 Tax=Baekduia soli TaxID=496014 RepID=A0A5B8U4K3_9ACTN|nr:EamA family transporter [Baekduia soli]QEC48014.1 EamA family transporter [Baekduia soli]
MRTGAGHIRAQGSPPQDWRVWSAIGAVYVIWGGTYLAIRLMIETVPPLLGAGVRFVAAGVIMLAFLAARRGGPAAIATSWGRLAHCALVGTLLAAGGNGLVTIAEHDVPTGLTALIIASVPLWIALFRTLGGDRVAGRTLAGVALGFVGVGVLLLPGAGPPARRSGWCCSSCWPRSPGAWARSRRCASRCPAIRWWPRPGSCCSAASS